MELSNGVQPGVFWLGIESGVAKNDSSDQTWRLLEIIRGGYIACFRYLMPMAAHPFCCHKAHDTAGPKWFDMPATEVTPEVKRELQLLKMRHVLDPTRFFRSNDSDALPKYFQVGKVVSSAADFYSSGETKRSRNKVRLILDDTDPSGRAYQIGRWGGGA